MQLHQSIWQIGVWLAAAGLANAAEADAGTLTGTPATASEISHVATHIPVEIAAGRADGTGTEDAGWLPVDADCLDAARGGFTVPGGLTVSLGIERMVSINGDVVAHNSVDVAGLETLNGTRLRQAGEALSGARLIQNGNQNSYAAGNLVGALPAIVVQNSLDNQVIRTETVISASVNSAALLNTLHFQGSLQDALTRAVAPR